jgi:transcriptional regulator with XRE-family HTH domain
MVMPRPNDVAPSPTLSSAYQCAILIRALRTFYRLSQHDLAKLSGVSRPTLDRIESQRGIERARQSTLEHLLDTFRQLGAEITFDPQQGAQVHFNLTAMALSLETLTDATELRDQLAVFERPAETAPSAFERLLALAQTQRSPVMERFRQRPFPSPADPAWQQAQQDAHAHRAESLRQVQMAASEADTRGTVEDMASYLQGVDLIDKEDFKKVRRAAAEKRARRTKGGSSEEPE